MVKRRYRKRNEISRLWMNRKNKKWSDIANRGYKLQICTFEKYKTEKPVNRFSLESFSTYIFGLFHCFYPVFAMSPLG